jgi:nitronate monooxygenase
MPDSPELELLSIALNSNVKAIWFAFGNEMSRWVEYVRDHDRKSGNKFNTVVFAQISSPEQALVAINDWKVDVIVAQGCFPSHHAHPFSHRVCSSGIEAGGHGHSSAPPLFTLIPAIASVLPNDPPPLIAAGGLSKGAHVASVLTLGAIGVALGTRFLLSPESLYSDNKKRALINANATARTMAFDLVRGSLGWPAGVDGRGLYNLTVEEFEKGISLEEMKNKYSPDDPDRMVVWAGTGVALMTVAKPAKVLICVEHRTTTTTFILYFPQDIVLELHQDCMAHLKQALSLINEP